MLQAAGYAKYGQETLISGITGEEMPCDIYIGLVYYQRLRHMVSDKFQVRQRGEGWGWVVGYRRWDGSRGWAGAHQGNQEARIVCGAACGNIVSLHTSSG
jgi:hypothetical protein